ncbi:glycerophosphodiester phosphodiesterase family protein [Streptomyces sp. MST-110588]|uniref:glycerophosphodiester phosphodiesterase n=1 Tax=Streptomyces sp. MST-110588 TaxID=2833628 RepID=UPI001F5D38C9|nr:glycerophosphodiester phosphodiesterase family protein [Streptomyces sp. MST-110588]UNO40661.1 glycerophosphodiester phosphodiesterase [Streptomyces sp. MST-110588]
MLRSPMRVAAAAVALLVVAAVPSYVVGSSTAGAAGAEGGAGAADRGAVAGPGAHVPGSAGAGGRAGVRGKEPVRVAHRGASRMAPENTLAAVDAAHLNGFDWVENDVQRTYDGELVVMHDTTLNRTTDVEKVFPGRAPWRVGDFTAAEIARLDAGSWFGKAFAGERVPTLADYLRRLDHNGQRLLLEVKSPQRYPGIEERIVRELRERGWLDRPHVRDRLIVQSFVTRSVRAVHRAAPQVRTAILGSPPESRLGEYAEFADQINPRLSEISSGYVAAVHRKRGPHGKPLLVYTWDVKPPLGLDTATAYGVDGVID